MITEHGSADDIHKIETAKFLRALVECDRSVQEIVLEMVEIVSDPESTKDERTVAYDAIVEALSPGTTTDVREHYRDALTTQEATDTSRELDVEERHFADRVRSLMAEKSITQEALANAAGIGQPAVSNILNRRCRPQRRTIARFAEALGVSPNVLWPEIEP